MDPVVRVLDVVFWITAAAIVGALVFLEEPRVAAVLMVVLAVCSGVIALYEFRFNPLSDSGRVGWTGRQLFYTGVFAIGLLVTLIYTLSSIF